ncbi:MAG TPA: ABC transporter substrate-binding protein [Burkholderiaceae bacterium]
MGQSANFSGGTTGQSKTYLEGVELCFDNVNQAGGVNGRKIELISFDDNQKPERTAENVRKLINEERVFALAYSDNTTTAMPAMALAEKANVPFLFPSTGAEELYVSSKNAFTFHASFKDELKTIIRHLATLRIDRVALVYYDLGSGKELLKQTNELLAAENLKLVGQGMMKFNSGDANEATKAIAKGSPKAVIIGVSGNDAVAFVRKMKQQSGIPPIFYARSIVNPKTLVNELGADSLGIVVTQTVPNPFNAITLIAKEYRMRLAEKNAALSKAGKPQIKPEYIGFEGFIAAKILVEGLRRAGKALTRERFLEALESMHKLDMGGYFVSFSKNNHNGSDYVDITMIGPKGRNVD